MRPFGTPARTGHHFPTSPASQALASIGHAVRVNPKHLPLTLAAAAPRLQQHMARTLLVSLLAFQGVAPARAQAGPAQGTATTPAATPATVAQPLRFGDFFKFPVGPRGLELSPVLQQASGQQVLLTGYMVQQENGSQPGQFFFTPRPVQMSEHADGDADDLPPATVLVKLAAEQSNWVIPHTRGLVQLQGTLAVGRQEASDGRVTWVQLQLPPSATRSMNPREWAGHLHGLQHRH